jgi:hypothetical protein
MCASKLSEKGTPTGTLLALGLGLGLGLEIVSTPTGMLLKHT